MITYTYKVSMTPGGIPVRCKLGQYDDDWTIVFTLYSASGTFSIESGTTAKIRGTKRDGLGYSANATINISAGTVTVAGDKQITAVAGDNLFELVLLKGTKELSTANIIFSVEPAAMDAGTLVSDSQVQEILDMSADVIAASANVSTLRGNFAPAYSSSATYVVGDYVMHDNQLYRCTTAITTAEAWTPAHWTAVSLGPAVSDLKSDLDYLGRDGIIIGNLIENEYVNTDGEIKSYQNWDRTDYIDISDMAYIFVNKNRAGAYNCFYDNNKSFLSSFSILSDGGNVLVPPSAKYVIISDLDSYMRHLEIIGTKKSDYYIGDTIKHQYPTAVVHDGTNYDTLLSPGSYNVPTVASASTMVNCPVGHPHRLLVLGTTQSNKLCQIIFPSSISDSIFLRVFDSETFGTWRSLGLDSVSTIVNLAVSANSTPISNGSDYDNLNVGNYYCASSASAQTMTHCPTIKAHRLLVMQTYNTDNLMQFIIENRLLRYRYVWPGHGGEAWKTVATLDDINTTIDSIPDYYQQHILTKETTINEKIANAGFYGDSFAMVADTHWDRNTKNSPILIKHIATHTPVNRLMMLGDYYTTKPTKATAYKALQDSIGTFKGKGMQMYIIPGNHDYNYGTVSGYPILTEFEVYGQIMTGQNDVVRSDDTCTFYFDNTQLKIRYYFTSCMYDSSYNVSSYKWIFRNMEDIPEGYKVIVFTHTGLSGSGARNHNYAQYLTGALKALRDKTIYTFDNEEFDYSNTNGLPIAIFSGHHHIDYVFSDNGIACIQVTTDAYYYEDSSSYDDPEIPVLNREIGTDSEQAFDVATVETYSNTVYLTRIGAGRNRIIHCSKAPVSTTVTLTSELSGSLTWGSTNANVATVSDGTVTKAGDGSCMISAADISGNVEYWNIVT